MPLVNINIWQGMPEDVIDQIHQATHTCLVEAWGIPTNGGFYLITERPQSHMRIQRTMWGVERSDHPPILLQITSSPRSCEMKTRFYQLMAEAIQRIGFRQEDLFISITPNNPEDWSFGGGIAQLLDTSETNRSTDL